MQEQCCQDRNYCLPKDFQMNRGRLNISYIYIYIKVLIKIGISNEIKYRKILTISHYEKHDTS